MNRSVEVRLGSSDRAAQQIGRVASRLGADLVVRASESEATSIGDVVIPEVCEDWLIEAAVLREVRPDHLLFLCVANSARSQLAEGIARDLASRSMKVSSAGTVPTAVHPQAVAVLDEIGVDISSHASGHIDGVERPVDTVVTLCVEEVCPLWLEDAWRVYWPLPDPAAVDGNVSQQLAVFRSVRDEIQTRLGVLCLGTSPV